VRTKRARGISRRALALCALALPRFLGLRAASCASECATHFEFYVMTILFFSTTTSVALATSDLGVVLSLTGAVAASLLGYVLPPLLFLASHKGQIFKRQEQNGGGLIGLAISLFPRYSLPVGMIAFGCVACVLGVVSVFLPGGL